MKARVLFVIFMAFLAILFGALGGWQIARDHEKSTLQQRHQEIIEKPVENFKTGAGFFLSVPQAEALLERGQITGRFFSEKTIFIAPRTKNGVPGAHVLTPFLVEETGEKNFLILVNRGWIIDTKDDSIKEKLLTTAMPAPLQIKGYLQKFPKLPWGMMPPAIPDFSSLKPVMWSGYDYERVMQTIKQDDDLGGYPLSYYVFYTETSLSPEIEANDFASLNFYDRHLLYAGFWFVMSFLVVLLTMIRIAQKD